MDKPGTQTWPGRLTSAPSTGSMRVDDIAELDRIRSRHRQNTNNTSRKASDRNSQELHREDSDYDSDGSADAIDFGLLDDDEKKEKKVEKKEKKERRKEKLRERHPNQSGLDYHVEKGVLGTFDILQGTINNLGKGIEKGEGGLRKVAKGLKSTVLGSGKDQQEHDDLSAVADEDEELFLEMRKLRDQVRNMNHKSAGNGSNGNANTILREVMFRNSPQLVDDNIGRSVRRADLTNASSDDIPSTSTIPSVPPVDNISDLRQSSEGIPRDKKMAGAKDRGGISIDVLEEKLNAQEQSHNEAVQALENRLNSMHYNIDQFLLALDTRLDMLQSRLRRYDHLETMVSRVERVETQSSQTANSIGSMSRKVDDISSQFDGVLNKIANLEQMQESGAGGGGGILHGKSGTRVVNTAELLWIIFAYFLSGMLSLVNVGTYWLLSGKPEYSAGAAGLTWLLGVFSWPYSVLLGTGVVGAQVGMQRKLGTKGKKQLESGPSHRRSSSSKSDVEDSFDAKAVASTVMDKVAEPIARYTSNFIQSMTPNASSAPNMNDSDQIPFSARSTSTTDSATPRGDVRGASSEHKHGSQPSVTPATQADFVQVKLPSTKGDHTRRTSMPQSSVARTIDLKNAQPYIFMSEKELPIPKSSRQSSANSNPSVSRDSRQGVDDHRRQKTAPGGESRNVRQRKPSPLAQRSRDHSPSQNPAKHPTPPNGRAKRSQFFAEAD